jgi:L-2,4-diaminobutyrate transaminase
MFADRAPYRNAHALIPSLPSYAKSGDFGPLVCWPWPRATYGVEFAHRAKNRNAHNRKPPEPMTSRPLSGAPPAVAELDRRFVFHPFTQLDQHSHSTAPIITEGKGVTLRSSDGRSFLDALAGLWCVNAGYGREEIGEAMRAEAARLGYYHAFSSMATDLPAELAARILPMYPVPMSKVFFGNSGSDANDTQIKLVWYFNNILRRPEKKKIVSRARGYHGVTVMTAGITGLPGVHAGFDLPLPMIRHTLAPHRLWEGRDGENEEEFAARLANELERLIIAEGPETVAAFIAEPLQGAGGVIVPPRTYWQRIQEVLREYDVLLIADEVITGFGRLGHWFGAEEFGIEPDLVTVAKGITSGYVPLSGCFVSEKVWNVLVEGSAQLGPFGHGYTYSAHPIAAAAALANLDILEREGLVEQAAVRGTYLQERLRQAFEGHPLVAEVRGLGLIAAVELARGGRPFDPALRIGPRVYARCLEHGLITRALPAADTIAFSPPFVVSETEIDEMVTIARHAVDEIAAELE